MQDFEIQVKQLSSDPKPSTQPQTAELPLRPSRTLKSKDFNPRKSAVQLCSLPSLGRKQSRQAKALKSHEVTQTAKQRFPNRSTLFSRFKRALNSSRRIGSSKGRSRQNKLILTNVGLVNPEKQPRPRSSPVKMSPSKLTPSRFNRSKKRAAGLKLKRKFTIPKYDLTELFENQPDFAEPPLNFSNVTRSGRKGKDLSKLQDHEKIESEDYQQSRLAMKASSHWMHMTNQILQPKQDLKIRREQKRAQQSIYELGKRFPMQFRRVSQEEIDQMRESLENKRHFRDRIQRCKKDVGMFLGGKLPRRDSFFVTSRGDSIKNIEIPKAKAVFSTAGHPSPVKDQEASSLNTSSNLSIPQAVVSKEVVIVNGESARKSIGTVSSCIKSKNRVNFDSINPAKQFIGITTTEKKPLAQFSKQSALCSEDTCGSSKKASQASLIQGLPMRNQEPRALPQLKQTQASLAKWTKLTKPKPIAARLLQRIGRMKEQKYTSCVERVRQHTQVLKQENILRTIQARHQQDYERHLPGLQDTTPFQTIGFEESPMFQTLGSVQPAANSHHQASLDVAEETQKRTISAIEKTWQVYSGGKPRAKRTRKRNGGSSIQSWAGWSMPGSPRYAQEVREDSDFLKSYNRVVRQFRMSPPTSVTIEQVGPIGSAQKIIFQ